MASDRINTRLPEPLAQHVGRMVGTKGLYETPSEYIRDLIRRDMESRDAQYVRESVAEGYEDLAAGRHVESTGDFKKDREAFKKKEAEGWR